MQRKRTKKDRGRTQKGKARENRQLPPDKSFANAENWEDLVAHQLGFIYPYPRGRPLAAARVIYESFQRLHFTFREAARGGATWNTGSEQKGNLLEPGDREWFPSCPPVSSHFCAPKPIERKTASPPLSGLTIKALGGT